MKNRRLGWVAAAVILLALVLAFPLRDVFQRTVVIPLAYFLWSLGLFYRSVPQLAWWIVAVMIVATMLAGSFIPGEKFYSQEKSKSVLLQGQVEGLAVSIHKASRRGVYFKWIVANRLGNLAYQMLVRREGDKTRSVFAPLVSADWQPAPLLQKYLETGLHGSFSDYPDSDRFTRTSASPLDLEVREAVEFLESQLETRA